MVQPAEPTALPSLVARTKTAAQVSDFCSHEMDLSLIVAFCDELEKLPSLNESADAGSDFRPVAVALWQAIAITYRRIFTSGKSLGTVSGNNIGRLQLPDEWIDELSAREVHKWVIELADRHVAHRVSPAEQVVVYVHLNPPGSPKGIAAVTPLHLRLMEPDRPISEVRQVATALRESVRREIVRGLEAVARNAEAMGLDFLYERAAEENGTHL